MFGNKKVDIQKATQNIARQKIMRGQAGDANLIQGFGSIGTGAALQALSSTLRGKTSQSNNNISTNGNLTKVDNSNKRKAAGIINSINKSGKSGGVGGNILGALGK